MATYMIGYDLNRPGQDYSTLIDDIKSIGSPWWHHLESTWLVVTSKSEVQIRDQLKHRLDRNDELLVAKLSGDAAWIGFSDEGSKWLKDNL